MTTFDRAIGAPPNRVTSLTLAAVPRQLHVLRELTRLEAKQLSLSHDVRADLVLAVDEAAGTLVGLALSPRTLTCTFDITAGELFTAVISATAQETLGYATESFEWFVLQTLVDGVTVDQSAHVGSENWSVQIVLDKVLRTV
ncbi:hypothetical protein [Rhodococcus sp. NPDC056516]|uniref:hypothetical protein n=1 Tax=unclassified Rhodococcus (in: high G+C Gram-positive bacteria) TaxID=192944 RepID=UPI00366BD014